MYALIYIFVLLAAVSTTVANPISKVYDELSSLDEEDIAFGIDTSKSQEYNDLTYRVHDFFRQDALNLENSFTVAAEDSDCSANKDRSRSIEIRSQPKSDQTCSPRKSPIWVMPENPACKQDPKGRPRDVYCCLGGYRQGIQKIKLQCVSYDPRHEYCEDKWSVYCCVGSARFPAYEEWNWPRPAFYCEEFRVARDDAS